MVKDWRRDKPILYLFKSFYIVTIKGKRRILLGKLYKRLYYYSIVMDKIVIEVIEAKEGLDPFYGIRGFLVIDCFNLLRINLNSFYNNNKPKILYTFYPEFIFLNIYL